MEKFQGKCSEHPTPRLLQFIFEKQETGILRLSRQGTTKTLYLVHGAPVNAESTLRDETLGRYLTKAGRISEEEYEQSIALMLAQGLQQGAALVKQGVLKPKELYQEVKNHTREKILFAFAWTEGDYVFEPEVEFVEDLYRFELDYYEILYRGTRLYLPLGVVERELAQAPLEPLAPAADFAERAAAFGLKGPAADFVRAIDGTRTWPALCDASEDPELAQRLIYLFLLAGLVGPGGRPCREVREVLPEAEAEAAVPAPALFIRASASAPEVAEELPVEEEPRKGREDILTAYMEIKGLDLFAVLGLDRAAGDAEVERAYRARLAEFDRGHFSGSLPAEAEAKLEEINTRLIRAYESLKTAEKRGAYLAQLEQTAKPAGREPRLQSEKYLQEGMKFVRAREFAQAQTMFEKAIALRPHEPEYYGYLGWTIYMNEGLDPFERGEQAEKQIRKAVQMNPQLDGPHVFLGKLLKDQGKSEESLAEFRKALTCNPNCREAKRELEARPEKSKGGA